MSTPTKLALLALLFFTSVLLAQETPPPPGKGPGLPGLPIDGIIWLGTLAAIAYGAVKKNKNFKK